MQLSLEQIPHNLRQYFRPTSYRGCGSCYVCHTVAWAREVRRVLRGDGVMFLVLGDSYAGGRTGRADVERLIDGIGPNSHGGGNAEHIAPNWGTRPVPDGLKPKDLVGIPWRVALALQADGWWLRSDVIWAKPNPMPESVIDRPTKAHEYVFLLAKSQRYYWDAEAVKEPQVCDEATFYAKLIKQPHKGQRGKDGINDRHNTAGFQDATYHASGRNLRTVWNIATQPYAGAHFAVFPEKLIEPMVKAATKDGDVILDPFGGSGTMASVALRLGRRAILCELNPDYIELQKERIEQTQPALEGL